MKQLVDLTSLILFYYFFSLITLGVKSETCNEHYSYSIWMPSENCPNYCCGTCEIRFCCSNEDSRLNQTECSSDSTANCLAYMDYYGNTKPSQTCSYFCCGDCDNRYCCSTTVFKLDQTKCAAPKTSTRKTQYSSSPSIFMWTFGVFAIILVMCGMASCLKYRANQYRMAHAVQTMSNMPQSTPRNARRTEPTTVGTNEAYQYDMNTIYNTNFQNDPPPSYESIKVQPKQPSPDEADKQETPV